MQTLDLEQRATVRVKAATEVRVKGEFDADTRVTIANDASAPLLRASQIKFLMSGSNSDCHHGETQHGPEGDTGGQAVVHIGEQSNIKANIYALGGTVWIMGKTTAIGAFIGKRVRIGADTQLTLDSAF